MSLNKATPDNNEDMQDEHLQAPDQLPPVGKHTNEILELNKKHAFVVRDGQPAIMTFKEDALTGREVIEYWALAAFRAEYGNKRRMAFNSTPPRMTSLAEQWLESPRRRQYAGVVFMPGSPEDVREHFNLFRGWPVEPIPGTCTLFWDHVRGNICAGNDVVFQFVRRWMAHAIQKPEEVPETALVMRGPMGTGKGRFAYWFGQLFGEHYRPVSNLDHLFGKFNGHMENAILVFGDEITWGGNKERERLLLNMITDDMLNIERKGKDMGTPVKNYRRFLFASNDDWPIAMGPRDRRFVILDVNDKHQQDHAYFEALNAQMENGGLQALMHELKTMDLTGFNPRKKPPMGAGAADIMTRSLPPTEKFWFEYVCRHDASSWPGQLNKDGLHAEYQEWCKKGQKSHPEDKPEFAKKLKALGGLKNYAPREDGKRPQGWKTLPFEATRKKWEEHLGVGPELWE